MGSPEALQTDGAGLNPDLGQVPPSEEGQQSEIQEDTQILEPEFRGATVLETENTEMHKDVDHGPGSERPEVVDTEEEGATDAEKAENSEGTLEMSTSEQEEGGASPRSEQSDDQQLEVTRAPELIQEVVPHDPSLDREDSPLMDLAGDSESEQPGPELCEQLTDSENSDESETAEQLCADAEVTQPTPQADPDQVDPRGEVLDQSDQLTSPEVQPDVPYMNGAQVDRDMACSLAERLFKLDGIQRVDVVQYLDKE